MKFSAVVLLAAVLALLSASTAANGFTPRAVCFRKTTKCCFIFRSCGFITKRVPVRRRCPYKKCEEKCRPHCYPHCKQVRVPYEKCVYKPVRVCRENPHGRKTCTYERKRHCRTHYRWVRKCHRVCERKCRRHCYYVDAVCVYYKIFRFEKYCPYLHCYRPTYEGPYKTPGHVISPKGRFVSATRPVRTDVDRRKH